MATQTETFSPSASRNVPAHIRRRSSSRSTQKKPWEHSGRPSFNAGHARPHLEETQHLSHHATRNSTRSSHRRTPKWYKIRWFRGMIDDVKRRAPYYWSDWRDAWDYRVVPATVYMYFAKYANLYLEPHELTFISVLSFLLPMVIIRNKLRLTTATVFCQP
jgi:hypothetical protein